MSENDINQLANMLFASNVINQKTIHLLQNADDNNAIIDDAIENIKTEKVDNIVNEHLLLCQHDTLKIKCTMCNRSCSHGKYKYRCSKG
jgi:hypothetical protein